MQTAAEDTASTIPAYKANFLRTCIDEGVLRFGTFELKSKRVSPYFFNAGLFYRADLHRSISTAYAETIRTFVAKNPLGFDVLFGPAYKAIPLAAATTTKLAELEPERFGYLSYSFNRKEAKDHGEGGSIVGCPLKNKRVVIIDDVITTGTAIEEAINIIKREGGKLVAIIVAVDRMERTAVQGGEESVSAIGQIRTRYGVPVLAILTLDDIMDGLSKLDAGEDMRRLGEYRDKYRAND
ncbi:MAG: orotate phosphoribosyltransferase [Geoglossum umbratile]|nr:MAG: orotate phosphoribosyltransferase [Geoglossum umbratile]